jgi:SAM-dependent methyltransferase
LNKSDKIKAIVLDITDAPERKDYLDDSVSVYNPQSFFQRFPRYYAFLKAIFAPNLPSSKWRGFLPDPSVNIVLNMGCGCSNLHRDIINVDFVKFDHVDIISDFETSLPIKSESVDGVLSAAVLEHVKDPVLHISEIYRVIKPGGKFFVIVPFLFPYHAAPGDYNRWTAPGIEKDLTQAGFTIELVKSNDGPFAVLIMTLSHILASALSFKAKNLYAFINFSLWGLFSPLKFLDIIFGKCPFAQTLCATLYVKAHKNYKNQAA